MFHVSQLRIKASAKCLGATLLLLGMFITASAGDWPGFRGDDQNTGQATGDFPANPTVLWSFNAELDIESTAAIVNGIVYVGSMDGYLYALHLSNGKLKWKYKATDEIKSSPAVSNNRVYFGDERGTFHALDAETGTMVWKFETEGGIISSARFLNDKVFVGSYDSSLYGLNDKDGSLAWRLETDGYIHGTAALYEDLLVTAGCDGQLRLTQTADGKALYNHTLGGNIASSVLVVKDRAYLGTFENQVVCFDLKERKIVWVYEDPERKFPYSSSPAWTGSLLLMGGRDKILHALDGETGVEKWRYRMRAKIESSPVVIGANALFADVTGKLVMVSHRDGKELWTYDTGSSLTASPALANGRMVIGLGNGTIYCFGAP